MYTVYSVVSILPLLFLGLCFQLLTVSVFVRQPVVSGVLVFKFAVHHAALLLPVVLVWVLTLMSVTYLELVVGAGASAATISRAREGDERTERDE